MANDVDVKIGITTTGDASGAQAVDKALDEVKQSAQEAASAAGDAAAQAAEKAAQAADKATAEVKELAAEMAKDPGTGGLADAIGDLDTKTTSLSDEKKKAGVQGLARALEGLARGDIATGVGGVAEALFQMAQAIPINPGAAIGLSLAGIAISGVLKAIRSDASETAETFRNEFGETLDEEMARLEAWSQVEMEWAGIKAANENIIKDFSSVVAAAAATQQAIEMIFTANIGSKVAGLAREKQQAVESGDKEKVAEIDRQVEQLRQYEELVKLNTSIAEEKAKLEELKVRIEEQAEAARKTAEEAEVGKQELIDLKEKITALWGNSDATRPGSSAQTELINSLQSKADYAGEEASRLARIKGYEDVAAARRLEEDSLRKLATEISGLSDKMDLVADQETTLAKTREESNEAAKKSQQEYTAVKAQIEALEIQLKDLASAAGPDVAGQAAEQAAYMTEATTKILEDMETLVIEDGEKIKQAGEAAFDGAKKAAGDLDGAREAYETSANQMGEAIGKIEKAAENIGNEAEEGGDQIKQGAQEFRTKLGEAAGLFSQAAFDLNTTALGVARQAADLAAEQRRVAAEVAVLRQQTAAALANSAMALSQIRNMG
jgi:chromosome segregation ATPase